MLLGPHTVGAGTAAQVEVGSADAISDGRARSTGVAGMITMVVLVVAVAVAVAMELQAVAMEVVATVPGPPVHGIRSVKILSS